MRLKMILAVLLVFGVLVAGCAGKSSTAGSGETTKPSDKVVKIGYVDSGKSFPNDAFAIAIEKGFLKTELDKVGYRLETIPFTGAGPAINEAIAGSSIDMATSGDVPVTIAKSNGVDTVLVAAEVGFNDAALVVPKDSGAKSIQDLKGKKVATLKGSYMHKTLADMLTANNLTINDIQFVNMTSQDAAAAIISKTVDAAVLSAVQEAQIVKSGQGAILLSGANNAEWKGSHGIIARSVYAKANKEAVTAVVSALIQAGEYAKANSQESITILEKSGYPLDALTLLFPDKKIDFNVVAGDNAKKAFAGVANFLFANELIREKPDLDKWIDSSYYQEASKSIKK
ncbi:ABC transporter substrate-binding protein [Sporomusa sp.]|uniref:ABC transporter substrate-binding protein n=1 Tax=Sporomusa sp. TaxID=2078658 RepID=UPI002CAC9D27|nr:ABC transporter substrate-binding protein [Sporomusa sp.]HWR09729.1 ABC transporter substrate-binding protein [Sporomusa sp.]